MEPPSDAHSWADLAAGLRRIRAVSSVRASDLERLMRGGDDGVSKATVWRILSGTSTPRRAVLRRLLQSLDVRAEDTELWDQAWQTLRLKQTAPRAPTVTGGSEVTTSDPETHGPDPAGAGGGETTTIRDLLMPSAELIEEDGHLRVRLHRSDGLTDNVLVSDELLHARDQELERRGYQRGQAAEAARRKPDDKKIVTARISTSEAARPAIVLDCDGSRAVIPLSPTLSAEARYETMKSLLATVRRSGAAVATAGDLISVKDLSQELSVTENVIRRALGLDDLTQTLVDAEQARRVRRKFPASRLRNL